MTHPIGTLHGMARNPPRFLGLLTVIILGPLGLLLASAAAIFLIRQFVSGWLPADWWSDSVADWAFGFGTKGSASNYLGFMVTAVPAGLCFSAVSWGVNVWNRPRG